jgi:hypothetical protein
VIEENAVAIACIGFRHVLDRAAVCRQDSFAEGFSFAGGVSCNVQPRMLLVAA